MINTKLFYRKRLKLLTMILIVIIGAFIFTGCEKYFIFKNLKPIQETVGDETPPDNVEPPTNQDGTTETQNQKTDSDQAGQDASDSNQNTTQSGQDVKPPSAPNTPASENPSDNPSQSEQPESSSRPSRENELPLDRN